MKLRHNRRHCKVCIRTLNGRYFHLQDRTEACAGSQLPYSRCSLWSKCQWGGWGCHFKRDIWLYFGGANLNCSATFAKSYVLQGCHVFSLPAEQHGVSIYRKLISTALPTAVRNSGVVHTLVNELYKVIHGLYYAGIRSNPGQDTKRPEKYVLR